MTLPWLHNEKQQNYPSRERTNRDLYNSRPWRKLRQSYIDKLTDQQYKEIPTLDIDQGLKSVLMEAVPVCEVCYRLLIQGAYTTANEGKICDHILCVNPKDWRQTLDGYFGQGLDMDNLQMLCMEHHQRKSARDRVYQGRAPG